MYVATPLPPLNFNHTGKTWPKNTDNDDINKNSGYWDLIKRIGTIAFIISKNKVAKPISLLPVLKALVAPILPDPIFLISFFKKNFVNKKPNGIDPIK